MSSLHFDQPKYGHLFWCVLVLLVISLWLELKRNAALDRFVSTVMQDRLVRRLGLSYRVLSIVLFWMALSCFVVALMKPQWGETVRTIPRVSAQIMVCLDVSKSMLAEDTRPNRLERAKAELSDLLSLMDGDQVGITAFAGKATVVCPMTTDFGFLRLIMRDLGPHSTGLGGTKLAEPIRLATEGFGEGGDRSRIILLITDGGDHDSFPLEAAEEAKKRGIQIITVGFGDEAGSRIEITNERTGETDYVRDENGEPVLAKLDGDLLRQLALETNGVYIPAGTGALDLESIFREHIRPLTRSKLDSTQEVVRNEAYFVPIAIGLIMLGISILVTGIWSPSGTFLPRQSTAAAFVVAFVVTISSDCPVLAQSTTAPENQTVETADADLPDATDESLDPRVTYNTAVRMLDTDLDRADEFFRTARTEAGSDGEIRFRAAYNLGWVEVKRADNLLDSDPKTALTHLQTAIDWFNRAIRIRPKDQDARHNLEVVMRRALELADSLENKDVEVLESRFDKLIEQQRSLQAEVGKVVELGHAMTEEDLEGNRFRDQLRQAAVQQRQLLSDANSVLEDAANELQELTELSDEDAKPEQRQRASQLAFATQFLQDATQRMGQARSQLRLRSQNRAYRRQSLALEKLKRARDMFREPSERIRVLLQDAMPLHFQTLAYANADSTLASDPAQRIAVPAWLTDELLTELQESIKERTSELSSQIAAAVAAMSANGGTGEDSDSTTPDDAADGTSTDDMSDEQQKRWRTVSAELESASDSFGKAHDSLVSKKLDSAASHQVDALEALQKAEEQLLDFRGLIERAFADQSQLQTLLLATDETLTGDVFAELVDAITQYQSNNRERIQRIQADLKNELETLSTEATSDAGAENQPPIDPDQVAKEQDKFRKAIQLSSVIESDMNEVLKLASIATPLKSPAADSGTEDNATDNDSTDENSADDKDVDDTGNNGTDVNPPQAADDELEADATHDPIPDHLDESHPLYSVAKRSKSTIENLQELRRLFFTIVQRLKESAQVQSNINDDTLDLAIDDTFPLASRGPIGTRQSENKDTSEQIASELTQQAESAGAATSGPATADQQASDEQAMQTIQQASELVTVAAKEMSAAAKRLESESAFELDVTGQHQQLALEKLLEAITLLQPPDDSQDQQDNSNEQEQQDSDQEQKDDESQQDPSQNQSNSLLQIVRDREAQRRNEKAKRARRLVPANGPDW